MLNNRIFILTAEVLNFKDALFLILRLIHSDWMTSMGKQQKFQRYYSTKVDCVFLRVVKGLPSTQLNQRPLSTGPDESGRSLRKQTILRDESRRSFEPKRTIFWLKADDLMKADDPILDLVLTKSRRSWSKRTIIFTLIYCIKADDPNLRSLVRKQTIMSQSRRSFFNCFLRIKADDHEQNILGWKQTILGCNLDHG